ncbi:MAG: cyclase family protein [Phycisphaerales bacterium]
MNIIDLSVPFIEGRDVISKLQDNLPVYYGYQCYAYDLHIKSHRGTYFETSAHVFRDGKSTADVAVSDLVLPGYCMRYAASDCCIRAEHFEKLLGNIAPNCAVLIDTGEDRTQYFSRDAAQWLAAHNVKLMGSSTDGYDRGFVNPTGFFIDLFKAEIPIIANLTNLHLLPKENFQIIVLPLKVTYVCTVPCRVITLINDSN